MAASLRDRLERIRNTQTQKPFTQKTYSKKSDPGQDWQQTSPGLWERQIRRLDQLSFLDSKINIAAFSKNLAGQEVELNKILFFDLETSGLSGGSGNIAFLASIGSISKAGRFFIRQIFMDDYPAEAIFLERLLFFFSNAEAIVTYNGASFDIPLLFVRLAMNGIKIIKLPAHVDMLHPARRLFRKTLRDCSLKNIEKELLDLVRINDIPGYEVPNVWFDFLKTGQNDRLSTVFEHNAMDVQSLAQIFLLIYQIALGFNTFAFCDPVGLASLQARTDIKLAEKTLKSYVGHDNGVAALALAKLYSRTGRKHERLALAPYFPENFSGFYTRSIYAEKQLNDKLMALAYAEQALSILKDEALHKKPNRNRTMMIERTKRKIDRLKGSLKLI